MRLLLSTDTIGGVWTYSIELARALASHGVEIALACLGAPPSDAQRAEALTLPHITMFEHPSALEWMDNPWSDVDASGEWLRTIADRFGADLVQLCSYSHASLDWPTPVVLVAHSCVFSWWRAVHGGSPPATWAEYHRRVSAGVASADVVIAPSEGMLASLREFYTEPKRACVIPNARSPRPFRPRTSLPVVLSAGRLWDPAKNIAALARVAADLPWPVLVAGNTTAPDGRTIQFENVRLLGNLAEHTLAAWLGCAGIYALPAVYEPFGLSVLEAALSRCPLILSDIPTLREHWDDAALFVPPNDDVALRDALLALIADGRLRYRLAHRAFERAREFSPAQKAQRYLAEYTQLLSGRAFPEEMVEVACA